MAEKFDPLVPGVPLTGTFRTSNQQVGCNEEEFQAQEGGPIEKRKSCVFVTRFEFRYLEQPRTKENLTDEECGVLVEISADIAVDYLVNLPELPPPEDLNRWGASNALLHAWPYWREFCHSTQLKMSLPTTIMPMMVAAPPPDSSVNGTDAVTRTAKKSRARSSKK
jgi:hypothetical protein